MEEAVFRALADPSRRLLLDRLFEHDGQTLDELCRHLPHMTRFGVMKHLKVLADAGLVATRKVGREKFHYLNPVPIQEMADRWIAKYAAPWAQMMTGLKGALGGTTMTNPKPKHVYQVYIRTTPEELWRAITDPELTQRYFFGSRAESSWRPGSPHRAVAPDGRVAFEGEVVEAEPPRRLVYTFRYVGADDTRADAPTRVTWEIAEERGVCRLTLVHDGFAAETATYRTVSSGWAYVLSNLKTFVETGEPLPVGRAA